MRKFNLLICIIILFYSVGLTTAIRGNNVKAHEDRIIKSFKVKEGQLFQLKADIGSVEVDSWDRNEVKIIVTKETDVYSKKEAEEIFES